MGNEPIHVAALSTRRTNIGDEFIRAGIVDLVVTALAPGDCRVTVFNKHTPWEFYPPFHPARMASLVHAVAHGGWRRFHNILSRIPGNRFAKTDVILQCGTPVIWEGAHACEWAVPFWEHMAKRPERIPLLNLGAGSCYAWSDPPGQLAGRDREYAAGMVDCATLTTARDPLASRLLSEASGQDVPVLECPAFLAAGLFHPPGTEPDDRFLLNVMPEAGHFDFRGEVRAGDWASKMDAVVDRLRSDFQVCFLCHGDTELGFARERWPDCEAVCPGTPEEYFTYAHGAFAALSNRMHAAVGLAGSGIPGIAVGTDTRLQMTRQVGLPSLFAPEAETDELLAEVETLIRERNQRSAKLMDSREQVRKKYLRLIRSTLEEAGFHVLRT